MLWMSPQEIADAAGAGLLPGMPATKRGVNAWAARAGLAETALARPRASRGGGVEYHIDAFPAPARVSWVGYHCQLSGSEMRPANGDVPVARAQEARVVILRAITKFQAEIGASTLSADELFCEAYNAGLITFERWITDEISSVSPRTLARWRKAMLEGCTVGKSGRPTGTGTLDLAEDGQVRNCILGAVARYPFVRAKHLRSLVCDTFGDELVLPDGVVVPVPSLRQFQNTVKRWKVEYHNELLRMRDPDGFRNKVEYTVTGTQRADRLNEIWQIDASPADVMLKGKRRHSIYLAIDVYSRRVRILVTPTPRAEGVGLLMRSSILSWGLPERVKTDNVL